MTVIRRSYQIEVCRVCGFHLSNGATPTGRCEHRDHWSAGGMVVDVVPSDIHRGAVADVQRLQSSLEILAERLERDRREPDKVLCYVLDMRRAASFPRGGQ